jgi:hypothetical protein
MTMIVEGSVQADSPAGWLRLHLTELEWVDIPLDQVISGSATLEVAHEAQLVYGVHPSVWFEGFDEEVNADLDWNRCFIEADGLDKARTHKTEPPLP